MEFEKYTVKGGIQQLPDRPKDSAAELKAKFDEAEKNIGEYINEKLIPKLEEMKKYSNEAFRHAGSVDPRDIPTLTVEDKGRVYNIGNSGTLKYTITYDGVVSENSFSNYLYLTGSYDGIEDEYLRSLKKIQIVSEDCSSYAHWGFTDGQETVFHLEAENGHYKEFKSGSEVTVSIEAELPLQFGDNIVWDGYYWDKLSCDVVDYVSENVSAPVQSGAVYNAIKEHSDNTEDFHGLPLTKGSGENSLQQKNTQANGKASFSEGMETIASGDCSHSAGYKTRAQGMYSFAQGLRSEARGHRSCAQGYHTVAQGENQHARGKFNIIDNENKYADIVGNGTSDEDRSNAYTLDWDGNVEFAGEVKAKGEALESTANKVTAINENSTDEQYPSAKAVWDKFNEKIIDKNVSSSDDFDEFTADYFNLTQGGSVILKGFITNEYNSYILFVQAGHEDVLSTHQTLLITNCYGRRTSLMTRIYTSNKWSEWESYLTTDSVRNDLTSTSTTSPLSANQGKVLNEKIGDIDEKIGAVDEALEEIIAIQNQLMGVSE